MYPLNELEESYEYYSNDRSFHEELGYYLYRYSGRPSPLYYASRLSERCQGRKVYLKREDLNHTGSHKINNTLGQVLLAKKMGKKRILLKPGQDSMEWQLHCLCPSWNGMSSVHGSR